MTPSTGGIPVFARDVGVDAAAVRRDGRVVAWVLSPTQSFPNAVRAVIAACPGTHPDVARRIARKVLDPTLEVEADDLAAGLLTRPPKPAPVYRPARRVRLLPVGVAVAATVGLLAAGLTLLVDEMAGGPPEQASAITALAQDAGWRCAPMTEYSSRCLDERTGAVLLVDSASGPTRGGVLAITYGMEKIVAVRFTRPEGASVFMAESGMRKLMPPASRKAGRWVLLGTSRPDVDRLAGEIEERASGSH